MLNGRGCPVPTGWPVDWALINSTALMNADPAGMSTARRWGLVTLDWQSGWAAWLRADPSQIHVEAFSAAACRALKARGSVRYCSIYHNMELSLEWLESQRRVMDDAHVEAGWFLRFINGSVFNHPLQLRNRSTGRGEGPWLRQYFINWSNPDAAAYFVAATTDATAVDGVDATFADDATGVPAEHPELQPLLNVSDAELAALQRATQASEQRLMEALAARGRTSWNGIDGIEGPVGGQWGMNTHRPPADKAGCAAAMRTLCDPGRQRRGLFMEYDTGWRENSTTPLYHNQTLAAFLVVRPPLGFLGTSYGLDDSSWNPLFAMDVGVPTGTCVEAPKAVFSRQWSKGTAALDCNTYTARLPFDLLPCVL